MPRYKCIQTLETHIQVEVEADHEVEAQSKASEVIVHMDDKVYNQQLIDNAEGGETLVEEIPNEYQMVQFCPNCIQDVLDGEIEFTEAVCITEVSIEECDNLEVDGEIQYEKKVADRGLVILD